MSVKKSLPVYFKENPVQSVDAMSGVIKGIVIIQKGEDKAGDNIDDVFLDSIVEMGNAQGQGVKCRFGHPNMCESALGSYLGRYKNFYRDENAAYADLYLDPISKSSPKGNLYDYTIDMANKNSDMFGNSIAFMPADSEMKIAENEDGTEKVIYFIRLKSFLASDLVDSPCATTDLFKSTDDFAEIATDFLDNNPQFFDLLNSKPELLKGFMNKYKAYKERKKQPINTKKNIKMDILNKAKELLGLITKSTTKESASTDNGMLYAQGALDVGAEVYSDEDMTVAAEDGEYTKDDGTVLSVSSGTISSIETDDDDEEADDKGDSAKTEDEKPEEKDDEEDPLSKSLKEELSTTMALLEEANNKIKEFEKANVEIEKALSKSKERIQELESEVKRTRDEIRSEIKSTFEPPTGTRSNKGSKGQEQSSFAPKSDFARNAVKAAIAKNK